MKSLLTDLIDAVPEGEKGAQVQILLAGGMFAGAVRHAPGRPGLFELLTPNIDRRTGQPVGMVSMIFNADYCAGVMLPSDEKAPILHVPSRQVIPGVQ